MVVVVVVVVVVNALKSEFELYRCYFGKDWSMRHYSVIRLNFCVNCSCLVTKLFPVGVVSMYCSLQMHLKGKKHSYMKRTEATIHRSAVLDLA